MASRLHFMKCAIDKLSRPHRHKELKNDAGYGSGRYAEPNVRRNYWRDQLAQRRHRSFLRAEKVISISKSKADWRSASDQSGSATESQILDRSLNEFVDATCWVPAVHPGGCSRAKLRAE